MVRRFARKRGMREEPQRAESIIERHHDHAAARQRLSVVDTLRCCAGKVAAARNPHHHRPCRTTRRPLSRPHVQKQAVFAGGLDRIADDWCCRLRADGAICRVASRTPDQGCTAIGSRHRRSPVGGAAKGMPLNTAPLLSAAPRICPPVTPTIGAVCARLPTTATPTMSIGITTRIRSPNFIAGRPSHMMAPDCMR